MAIPVISPVVLARSAAHAALDAGFAKDDRLGIPFAIAVRDGGGSLIAQVRGVGAALASIGTRDVKTIAAVHFAQPIKGLQGAATSDQALFGLGTRDAAHAFVVGGIPITGATGAGSPEQDHEAAAANLAAIS
ncbi:heme-binding protein [Actinomyces sp. B33]|uniref:heme-binding protein n=1 Tax=Actinomyces sp. B33 TaxID=2942131 RepID=UPI002341AC6D|nr:heme-binding protein [Actinomyces sp. B33]MDC4233743.1 heme-binding protein [Actinomyces sp. B33]